MNAMLCSWDERSGRWLVVNQGDEARMRERAQVMYDTARKLDLDGVAFYVATGPVPRAQSPASLGVEVVGAETVVAPPPTSRDPKAAIALMRELTQYQATHAGDNRYNIGLDVLLLELEARTPENYNALRDMQHRVYVVAEEKWPGTETAMRYIITGEKP